MNLQQFNKIEMKTEAERWIAQLLDECFPVQQTQMKFNKKASTDAEAFCSKTTISN